MDGAIKIKKSASRSSWKGGFHIVSRPPAFPPLRHETSNAHEVYFQRY